MLSLLSPYAAARGRSFFEFGVESAKNSARPPIKLEGSSDEDNHMITNLIDSDYEDNPTPVKVVITDDHESPDDVI